MTFIVDGTNGLTFPNSTTQASAGRVLQVVQGNITGYAATQSTSFVTTGLTASITPKFASSKIAIFVSGQSYINSTNINCYYTIFRGTVSGTNLGNATSGMTTMYSSSTSTINGSVAMSYIDSPATTSSQTYTVGFRVENAAMTAYFATNSQTNTIILMEIAA